MVEGPWGQENEPWLLPGQQPPALAEPLSAQQALAEPFSALLCAVQPDMLPFCGAHWYPGTEGTAEHEDGDWACRPSSFLSCRATH